MAVDAARLAEMKNKLAGMEGLAASCVRAALLEISGGNVQFGRGLVEAIADLPDTSPDLNSMAKELEDAAG